MLNVCSLPIVLLHLWAVWINLVRYLCVAPFLVEAVFVARPRV